MSIRTALLRRRTPAPDHWDHPSQVEERSRNGKFTPEAERRQRELLTRGLRRSREFPYPEQSVTDALAALPPEPASPAPTFTARRPAPDRATRPIPELAAPAAADDEDAPEVVVLKKVLDGLNGLDWEALDAARVVERETYARTCGAPMHNALANEQRSPLAVAADGSWHRIAWRPPAVPVRRHGEAIRRRLADVTYPDISGFTAPGADVLYAELLRSVSVITGTTGIGNWRPVPATGGAR